MAAYYTKAEARAAATRTLNRSATRDSRRALNEAFASTKDWQTFDIFLSHSSHDAELILGVKSLLESEGFSVYVDWVEDAQLDRSRVTPENADLLRKRMRQSSSLIWVATEAAGGSKWMPWELGFFDGYKPGQVAVLPVLDSASDTFKGQEYLGLYPVVRKDAYASGRADVFVEDVGRRWATLRQFGKGQALWVPYP